MTPEQRARLEEWLPPSLVRAVAANCEDRPLDESTPGFVNLSKLYRREVDRDRDRLIDEARD